MLVDSPHKTSEITIAQSPTPLQRIGYGSCGSVWADTSRYPDIDHCESALVLKRADGLPDRSIENEANTHKHIMSCIEASGDLHGSNAFSSSFYVNIPTHTAFLNPGTPTWGDILPRLPAGSNPCQALRFWNGPADKMDSIIDDKRNEHCLIRPYLGRRRTGANSTGGHRRSMLRSISLRNYPLHIDQMEALGLPTHEYASAMADALAFLLWVAEIDACDVEYVLARPRSGNASLGTHCFTGSSLGPHALWVLDFDCCKPLPMTLEGVHCVVERFWRNDPFYPNPDTKCEEDELLWAIFRGRFLDTSGKIMASKEDHRDILDLPEQFIKRIIKTTGMYSKGVPTDSPT
ncbi:zinc finger protein-domain-containing protein [Cladorrhinum sp. PSN259]|nr:zinc finger protein-domain-containing protein [Cladorrhinum sp. PSN259]